MPRNALAAAAIVLVASFAGRGDPPIMEDSSEAAAQTECGETSVLGSLVGPEDPSTGRQRGRISIRYRDPGTVVNLLSPYFGSAYSDIRVIPRPLVFLQGFRSETTGDGFLQELTLDWLGDLELEIVPPGCPVVVVRCNPRGCAG